MASGVDRGKEEAVASGRQDKCFPDFAQGDALWLRAQRSLESSDRFSKRFETEAKRLVMNGNDVIHTRPIAHRDHLLGVACDRIQGS